MLVSEIGYLNLNSKNSYASDWYNKSQVKPKTNLNEGFGNVNEVVALFAENSNPFNRILSSIKSFFTPKVDESKTYLNMIA